MGRGGGGTGARRAGDRSESRSSSTASIRAMSPAPRRPTRPTPICPSSTKSRRSTGADPARSRSGALRRRGQQEARHHRTGGQDRRADTDRVSGDVAYVVVPAVYTFKEAGAAKRESAQMTFTLKKSARRLADSGLDVDGPETVRAPRLPRSRAYASKREPHSSAPRGAVHLTEPLCGNLRHWYGPSTARRRGNDAGRDAAIQPAAHSGTPFRLAHVAVPRGRSGMHRITVGAWRDITQHRCRCPVQSGANACTSRRRPPSVSGRDAPVPRMVQRRYDDGAGAEGGARASLVRNDSPV